ncbi:MAG: hypothetical protein ACI9MR_002481 [Myxococcota bacterium]|jgi:hypothetical protein
MDLRILIATALATIAIGCGDDEADDTSTDTVADTVTADTADTADASDVALDSTDATDADVAVVPVITASSVTVDADNPFRAVLLVTTDVPTVLTVSLTDADDTWIVPTSTDMLSSHEVNLLGLYAGPTFGLEVNVTNAAGAATTDASLTVEAGAMGADWPDFTLTSTPGTETLEPGYTFLTLRPTEPPDGFPLGMVFFVDDQGRPVWRHSISERIRDIKRRDNGNVVMLTDDAVVEVDMLNQPVSSIARSSLPTDTFHHEILYLPNGNLATLATELKVIDGYPADTDGGTSQNVVADVVVEFQPDGTVVQAYSLFDLLDPQRIVEGFFGGFWNAFYPSDAPTRDWTHGNAMYYDAADDTFVVCLRHQDWLVKIDPTTGDLLWTFGADGDFPLGAGGSWFYHPHAPIKTSTGTIMMFDNGIGRPGGGAPFSRVVEYEIDATPKDKVNWSATQVWEFTDDTAFFSPIFGDADILAGGHVLITDGARSEPPNNKHFARVIEMTHATPPVKLWELRADDETYGYRMYRAIRVPTL